MDPSQSTLQHEPASSQLWETSQRPKDLCAPLQVKMRGFDLIFSSRCTHVLSKESLPLDKCCTWGTSTFHPMHCWYTPVTDAVQGLGQNKTHSTEHLPTVLKTWQNTTLHLKSLLMQFSCLFCPLEMSLTNILRKHEPIMFTEKLMWTWLNAKLSSCNNNTTWD